MPAHTGPLEPEALLEHADWLRRLARALVSDDLVDDVVQETWVASLRQPPSEERAIRAWLRRVAGNVVRTRFRGERRRQARERLVSLLDEAVAPVETEAERSELSRYLADCLAQLGEPYRQVVLLRYYDDLSSADISRRLGLPAGTVRRRLKVGLDRLRHSLEGQPQRSWAWVWGGGLAALAAAAVVTLVIGARPVGRPPGGAAGPAGAIEGVVNGGDDRPVAGAEVTLSSLTTHLPVAELRTAGDGRFHFAGLPADRYTLSAAGEEGWAALEPLAFDGGARLRSDLKLEGRVLAVEGTVGEGGSDRATPGATVTAWEDRTDWLLERVYQTRVDEHGHYRMLLPPGRYRMRALAPGYGRSFAWPELTTARTLDFGLDPLAGIAGRIVEAGTGRPVPGARISWQSEGGRIDSVIADGGGHFRADVEPTTRPLWVRRGALFASAEPLALRPGPGGEAVIELSRSRGVRGRVLSTDGRPLGAVTVIARQSPSGQPPGNDLVENFAATISAADGSYHLPALPPGPLLLDASRPGLAPATVEVAAATGGDATIELRLIPEAAVMGRVRLAGGAAADGALVMARLERPGTAPLYRYARADGAGAFRLDQLPAGRVELAVQAGDQVASSSLGPLAAGEERPVQVTAAPAVWIAGRVLDPAGRPVPDAPVEALAGPPSASFGLYVAGVTDGAGQFRLGPFAGGTISVRPGWGGLPASGQPPGVRIASVRPGERTPSLTLIAAPAAR